MSESRAFFDTNVLLFLLSGDSRKSDLAEGLLVNGGVISVQVLNEFASVASRKLSLSWAEIREFLDTIRAVCRVEALTVDTHDQALRMSQRYGFSIYDSTILASALLAQCNVVFTEDLQDGQIIEDRITIQNPFTSIKK